MEDREAILLSPTSIVIGNSVWELGITTVPVTSRKPGRNEFENLH